MADLKAWRGEQQGVYLPGTWTCVLEPVWRLSLTPEEPGQGVGKSRSLPDSSQLLSCVLETSVDIDTALQLWL